MLRTLLALAACAAVVGVIQVAPHSSAPAGAWIAGVASAQDEPDADDPQTLWLLRPRWWRQPPDTPAAPLLEDAAGDRLAATWTQPESAVFPITDYDVQFRVSGAASYEDWDHAGTATRTTITGLDRGTAYEVRVRAANDLGPGGWSAPGVGMTTDQTVTFDEGERATRELAENTPPRGSP